MPENLSGMCWSIEDMASIKAVNHFSFTVSDLDRSVRFYSTALGLALHDVSERDPKFSESVTGIVGAHLRIAYLCACDLALELIQYLAPRGGVADSRTCNVGSAHICLIVQGMSEIVQKIESHGGRRAGAVCTVPDGPNKDRRVVYCEDPDGNTIELLSLERFSS